MYKALLKFNNKKVKLKLNTGQWLICDINILDPETFEAKTYNDVYYIHPSSVVFVKEYVQ